MTDRLPHSWSVEAWPVDVYPNRANKARYLVNTYKDDLVAAGVLVRVGRELVVLGGKYDEWLAKRTDRLSDYEIAPNRKRAGDSEATQ